jgi:hypothetical protein
MLKLEWLRKISEGVAIEDLIQNATEEEKFYLKIADPRNEKHCKWC